MRDDYETIEQIERHNVLCARRIVEYWRKQGVRIELPNDLGSQVPRLVAA